MTNITHFFFVWSGLKTSFCTDCPQSNYHKLKQTVFFSFCHQVKTLKHYPVYIISQTKCTTNIFVWQSGFKTWFRRDCYHSNYQMLMQKVFFVLWTGLKIFCSVYYQSQVHSKYFCLTVRLKNIIPWRLLVTIVCTCCISIIYLKIFLVAWIGLEIFCSLYYPPFIFFWTLHFWQD